MTELELIIQLHRGMVRQGPGSNASTLRALELTGLPKDAPLTIADLGCGTGAPTLALAQQLNAQLSAVDLFPLFLESLDRQAQHLGLQDKITTIEESMDNLPFAPTSLDLIWSEGAIYNLGFANGIQQWRKYLKPGGYLAVSEITWITNTRPQPIEAFWQVAYPEIDTAANKIRQLEQHGYALTGYFYLPSSCWLDNYYLPLEASFPEFLQAFGQQELAHKVVADNQREIDLYRQYQDYYSYGFYVAKKVG